MKSAFSDHIPNLNLITHYAESGSGWFHHIHPVTKVILLVLCIILITISSSLPLICGIYLLIMLVYASSGLPLLTLIRWYTLPLIFVLSLIGIMIWNEPGTVLLVIPLGITRLNLTYPGLFLLITLLLKALISVTYSLLFLMTTRYVHLSGLVSRIFPKPIDQIFLMSYRFLFLILDMVSSLIRSLHSRSGGILHGIRVQGRTYAEIFALIFIRAFDQADRVEKAMRSRGYSGTYSVNFQIPPVPIRESVFIFFCSIGLAGIWYLHIGG